MKRLLVAVFVGLIAAVVASPAATAEDGVTTVCRFSDDRLTEISGMTLSLRHPDVIWLHNDSSGGPYVYAVDATSCETLARITIAGIDARDIEAIGSGRDAKGRPVLWVADIGDNLDSWPDVRLHRFREPKSLVDQTVTPTTYRFTYRDRPHNAEALLVDPNSKQVWIVTKQLAHGRLYKLPKRLSTTEVNVAKPIGQEGGLVTDGSVSPDGTRYVLRDYVNATVFDGLPAGRLAETIGLPIQPQGETVTWTADGRSLLIASERDTRLLRVDVPSVAPTPTTAPEPTESTESATPAPSASQTPSAAPDSGRASSLGIAVAAAVVLVAVAIVALIAAAGSRRRRGA